MQMFNAKDKPGGTIRYDVLDVTQEGGKKILSVQAEMRDDKKEEIMSTSNYKVACDGDNIYIDMSAYFNQQQLQAYKEMDMSLEAEDFVLPAGMGPGTALKDARATIKVSNEGKNITTMSIHSSGKKVTGEENITVPAGTFDCLKIEGVFLSEIETFGIPIKINLRSVEWYSKGVGLVRSESYNKKGKLMGYMVLSERY